ncbi:MAG: type II toxin-antitoxin system RelE/ParE family toxin [Clostridia bacterium]|nr:type II toxin-antitoxin system RelE/ParE family toxin [Clostridia bacterium]
MKNTVEYYIEPNGKIPVLEFLKSITAKNRAKAIKEIELLEEHGFYLGMPHVKKLQGEKYKGLYELRIRVGSDSSRIFYFVYDGDKFILLNGFIKKDNKTSKRELERAINYKSNYERGCN